MSVLTEDCSIILINYPRSRTCSKWSFWLIWKTESSGTFARCEFWWRIEEQQTGSSLTLLIWGSRTWYRTGGTGRLQFTIAWVDHFCSLEAVVQFNCGRWIVNIRDMEFGNKSSLQLVVLGVLVVLVNGRINLLLIVNSIRSDYIKVHHRSVNVHYMIYSL